ncbi:hypothetical protein [Rhizobium sp. LjRoot258]|jgi:quercetin dioxygenase-like cupin family protein|uniref:hypothetical protein n=1 Tax=Rhizobium sp. LjRoot258 TaxID=3342299 RepID=UPI003ED0CB4C
MEDMSRRSALALGLAAAAATPLLGLVTPARARDYGPTEGTEMAPGVRVVDVGTWKSDDMTGIKSISVVDVVFQPGAKDIESVMEQDMICHITAGEFTIKKADREFNVKEGEYYTCGKGKTDHATNISNVVGVHRVAILMPA